MTTLGEGDDECEDDCCEVDVEDDCCGTDNGDDCCGDSAGSTPKKDDCVSPESPQRKSSGRKVNSYGAVAPNVAKEPSGCGGGGCCSGK